MLISILFLKPCYKQVGLLNVDGYYDSLLALFDKGVEEGFIEDSARKILVSANTAEELLKKMEVDKNAFLLFAYSFSWLGSKGSVHRAS